MGCIYHLQLLLILVQIPKGGAKPRQNEPNYTWLLLLIKYVRKYRRDKIGPSPYNAHFAWEFFVYNILQITYSVYIEKVHAFSLFFL